MKNINEVVKGYGPASLHAIDTNNCAVNALAVACEVPYDLAYEFAKEEWKRPHRRGTSNAFIHRTFSPEKALTPIPMPFDRSTTMVPTQTYYKNKGKLVMRKMTIGVFLKTYPKGTFYVLVKRHALVIKDGVLIDNNSSLKRRILNAWEVKPLKSNEL